MEVEKAVDLPKGLAASLAERGLKLEPLAYACANILISRAGSNTLCEILALRKPALLIPYPMGASRGDQIVNARSFEARGLSRVLMQEDMTADRLVSEVISLYRERGSLYEKMDKEPSANGVENVLKEIYAVAGC